MATPNDNGTLKKWIVRVTAGLTVAIIMLALTGCAVGLIRNGNRITALETRVSIEYRHISEALKRIEAKVKPSP